MTQYFIVAGLCAVAYLLGAVPFGFLIARMRGVDIRTVGSCNIGATNVFRSVGKTWGILTFICDLLKGFLPVFFFPLIASRLEVTLQADLLKVAFTFLAIIGHNWPVYLGFKGGKGVATTAGALLGMAPAAFGIGLASWILIFVTTRYVSVASILAAAIVAGCGWWLCRAQGLLIPVVLTVLGILVIIRHKANIKRLMNGTENRFDFKRKNKSGAKIENTTENSNNR